MVETLGAHACRLDGPDVWIVDVGHRVGNVGLGVKLNAMTGGYGEADATADAGLFAGRHVIDGEFVGADAFFVADEIYVRFHFVGDQVIACRIRAAQNDRMMIEFISGLEINATVGPLTDLMQPDPLGVVLKRRRHVEHTNLNNAGAHNARNRHVSLPV